jgi:hypothetical protein
MCAQHPKTVSFIPVIVALIASFRQHRLYDGFAGVSGGSAGCEWFGVRWRERRVRGVRAVRGAVAGARGAVHGEKTAAGSV